MTILYNIRCQITRDVIVDDEFGGADVVTGTIIAADEPCRLDYFMPKANAELPQGIEVSRTYSLFFRSTRQHPINVREEDIIKIIFPIHHADYNRRFRVRGIQGESLHPQDPNYIIECTLFRIDETRSEGQF